MAHTAMIKTCGRLIFFFTNKEELRSFRRRNRANQGLILLKPNTLLMIQLSKKLNYVRQA